MATIDWPTSRWFEPREWRISPRVPKSSFSAFFTGQITSVSHLADRLRVDLVLRACEPDHAAEREAYFTELVSTGDYVRMGHMLRPIPRGTLRGSPTVATAAAAGARAVTISGTVGQTLLAGDVLGAGDQLLPVAYTGAVVGGGGTVSVPLQLPLRVALTAGQALTWNRPTGLFQLLGDTVEFVHGRGMWQQPLSLSFLEVF